MRQRTLVFRPSTSEYQASDFNEKERASMTKLGLDYSQNFQEAKSADQVILITTSQIKTDELKGYLKELEIKLIIHPNSGYDNFTKELVESFDSHIVIGNQIRAAAVFQYTTSCLLDALGKIPFENGWDDKRLYSRNLKKKVTVYGRGHIGKKLEKFLIASDMNFNFIDPYQEDKNSVGNHKIEETDIFILLCSLNEKSYHILGKNFFSNIKESSVIINPARGKLIDETVLIEFLNKNKKSFAYLDVFENEPKDLSALSKELKNNNALLSSHVAGVYDDIDDAIIEFETKVISDYLSGDIEGFKKVHEYAILSNRLKDGILI